MARPRKQLTGQEQFELWRNRQPNPVRPSIIAFTTDVLLLSLSDYQRTLLKSIYGEPLTDEELEIFKRCTGRTVYPKQEFNEITVCCGAQSGKDSRIVVPVVFYTLMFEDDVHAKARLGEPIRVILSAPNADLTEVAFKYISGRLENCPMLESLMPPKGKSKVANEIRLGSGVVISCVPCTKVSARGFGIPAGVLDEVGFFRLEGAAVSDVEVQTSIQRGMPRFPRHKLLKISTPYMRGGLLWDDSQRYFGNDDAPVLYWTAKSADMNPALMAPAVLKQALDGMGPTRFAREFEAVFAEDLASFLSSEWIDQCRMRDRFELPPVPNRTYLGAMDPSGGGEDAFAFAIVHVETRDGQNVIVQDVGKAWGKSRAGATNLDAIVREIVTLAKQYKLTHLYADRYAKGWVREAFRRISGTDMVRDAELAKGTYVTRSDAYLECEPLFVQGRLELLDDPTTLNEFRLLERKPSPGGRDKVEHPQGKHDDRANAVALASAIAAHKAGTSKSGAVVASAHKAYGAYHTGEIQHVGDGVFRVGNETYRDPRYS